MASPLAVQAVVVDWAGTIVDHGSRAPVEAFREVFRRRNVPITVEEARGPMGMEKRDHIVALLNVPRIDAAWRQVHGHVATEVEVDAMYHEFLPVQMELLASHADVIPGVLEMFAELRRRGIKIGSSSGYAAPLMTRLVELARSSGLEVDSVVSATEVASGRPAPLMVFRNMDRLGVFPPASVVTVDDTTVGVEAGVNAGTWTVGVVETGNLFGLTPTELSELNAAEREERFAAGRGAMLDAGAHYVIRSAANLAWAIDSVTERLGRGERP